MKREEGGQKERLFFSCSYPTERRWQLPLLLGAAGCTKAQSFSKPEPHITLAWSSSELRYSVVAPTWRACSETCSAITTQSSSSVYELSWRICSRISHSGIFLSERSTDGCQHLALPTHSNSPKKTLLSGQLRFIQKMQKPWKLMICKL